MSGVLVVATRELKARWMVLAAALVAGLMAVLLPVFSSLGRHNARDARELLAVIFAEHSRWAWRRWWAPA